ncbi:MAG: hypothetical protein A2Z50_01445 [Nitrospirae bacterium RBG_19FT_COMBO_42_15]|nr:MAG: hypothetical protein A2Z50_01445 [Nitrospirae bacterium RBG_19FT_COMBO_42_15]
MLFIAPNIAAYMCVCSYRGRRSLDARVIHNAAASKKGSERRVRRRVKGSWEVKAKKNRKEANP